MVRLRDGRAWLWCHYTATVQCIVRRKGVPPFPCGWRRTGCCRRRHRGGGLRTTQASHSANDRRANHQCTGRKPSRCRLQQPKNCRKHSGDNCKTILHPASCTLIPYTPYTPGSPLNPIVKKNHDMMSVQSIQSMDGGRPLCRLWSNNRLRVRTHRHQLHQFSSLRPRAPQPPQAH
eukprot:SAG11_NODE_593_length_8303_cov_9.249756_2_plen_176_part_00